VGALPREAALGDFIDSWKTAFDGAGFTVVNAANAIGNLFAIKDEQEQVRGAPSFLVLVLSLSLSLSISLSLSHTHTNDQCTDVRAIILLL
jgi:nucleosome binding factor SPN SPT16 subunit